MTPRHTALITGNSSGIGYGLSAACLARGWSVYGLSRRGCSGLTGDLHDMRCDLTDFAAVGPALARLLEGVDHLNLVVLNAGVLGEISDLHAIPLEELRRVMDINLWANKAVMDWLHGSGLRIDQIVFMSSGAAVNGNRGWGGYALSKAALNMMAQLYAHEFPDTHIAALAPGLVHTAMQDAIRDTVDSRRYPSTRALKDAIGTALMPEPLPAGERLVDAFGKLPRYPSGSFLDLRTLR
jgi:NAD(P)-dependent dehydrogenase (short-subunit alcohol dehydrogenase family)